MKKFLAKWKRMPLLDRILNLLVLLCSTIVIIFALLNLLSVWEASLLFCMPLMAIVMLSQGIVQLRMRNRSTAIISFCSGGVITICYIVSVLL